MTFYCELPGGDNIEYFLLLKQINKKELQTESYGDQTNKML